jgi:hypothetical protein
LRMTLALPVYVFNLPNCFHSLPEHQDHEIIKEMGENRTNNQTAVQ